MRFSFLVAFAPAIVSAQVATATESDSARARRDSVQRLESVTVSAIRARDRAPAAAATIDAGTIERRSIGQDLPLLLSGTPSLTSYAETGNQWGYSYIRLRGIDQSRINITLDGIPLNDPEDQVLYFADFPDLANSLASVQVQRGVGTSAPGTASYGGSINMQTTPVAVQRRRLETQLQAGSLGSYRGSVEYSTGLTARGLALSTRASLLQSDGYRRHSGTEGRSAFVSAAYVGQRDVMKLTALTGTFADALAYIGATRAELAADERANILRPDERDRFTESVLAISHARAISPRVSVSNTVYRTAAGGDYDVCIDSDCSIAAPVIWNFNLDFTWYGATSVTTIDAGRARIATGVNANTYARDHHAYDRNDLATPLYFNTGHKSDASAFLKVDFDAGRATLFADLQGRRAAFRYEPDVNAGVPESRIDWAFFNPRIGLSLALTDAVSLWSSYGINAREPARSDMLGGFDNLDTSNDSTVGPLSRVRPERVRDAELGLRRHGGRWSADATVFAMEFRDEILPVGQLTYIGTPLRTNVPSSWRRGIEVDARAQLHDRLALSLTTTLMRARIASFTDDAAARTYTDVPPLLTPEFTSAQRASFAITNSVTLDATGRFVGNSRLNNADDPALSLPSQYTVDLAAHWAGARRGVSLFVNNAANSRRYASGHVAFGEARYYVLPPLNAHVLVRVTY